MYLTSNKIKVVSIEGYSSKVENIIFQNKYENFARIFRYIKHIPYGISIHKKPNKNTKF
jgi:hypothetical protein